MEINKSYPCDARNYRKGRRDSIKYIVIHYVGATGSALNNAKYYGSANVGASAHFFVGHASEGGAVYQSVAPADCAWHCGSETGKYYSPCRNDSAIGIELCCHKTSGGEWYFDDITVEKAVELTKQLMREYEIDAEHVIRHYDVTHKCCPAPFVLDPGAWERFKKRLGEEKIDMEKLKELEARLAAIEGKMIYNYVDKNMPEWARPTVQKLVDKGLLRGDENGELHLTDEMLKMFVVCDRAGVFGE